MLGLLQDLKQENILTELDIQFAKLIDRKQAAYAYPDDVKQLALFVSALVSFNVRQGHSGIALESQAAENPFGLAYRRLERDYLAEIRQKIGEIQPLEWENRLRGHCAFSSDPQQIAPMLFQNAMIYFYRYWQSENRIAAYLRQAVAQTEQSDGSENREILDRLFAEKKKETDQQETKIDWQKVAVATALQKPFCVISGGPGTGKTYTVAKLLAALQWKRVKEGGAPLHIALAAPTGKAASRLKESIANAVQKLPLSAKDQAQIVTEASTLHSLLGINPRSDLPKYHQNNPLHLDLLVVDEASMIDLVLMEKLINALKPTTRLILLGDKDQLASVEAGAIMGELGSFIKQGYSKAHQRYLNAVMDYPFDEQQKKVSPLCDCLCHLRESRRFEGNSEIGQLARCVNEAKNHKNDQNAKDAWSLLQNKNSAALALCNYDEIGGSQPEQHIKKCVEQVVNQAVELYRPYLTLVNKRFALAKKTHGSPADLSSATVADIFSAFEKVRFLAALRVGELGVENLNEKIAEALRKQGLISFSQTHERYSGKPLLITENAAQHQIYNGDIGIILPNENGELRAYFKRGEQSYSDISLNRLPEYEAGYVMTVHKSQGSEFAHTLLVLPTQNSPIVTKELIYTAITRAKPKNENETAFTLYSSENVFKDGVKRKVERQSGLAKQIDAA